MAQTVTRWIADGLVGGRQRRAHVSVRVWRQVAGAAQGLFLFAGAVDEHALRGVMQQVQRLTRFSAGSWRVEVIATGLDGPLLLDVEAALWELQRGGVPARLAHAHQLRPEVRELFARAALLPA